MAVNRTLNNICHIQKRWADKGRWVRGYCFRIAVEPTGGILTLTNVCLPTTECLGCQLTRCAGTCAVYPSGAARWTLSSLTCPLERGDQQSGSTRCATLLFLKFYILIYSHSSLSLSLWKLNKKKIYLELKSCQIKRETSLNLQHWLCTF